jgi:hypothetical protein
MIVSPPMPGIRLPRKAIHVLVAIPATFRGHPVGIIYPSTASQPTLLRTESQIVDISTSLSRGMNGIFVANISALSRGLNITSRFSFRRTGRAFYSRDTIGITYGRLGVDFSSRNRVSAPQLDTRKKTRHGTAPVQCTFEILKSPSSFWSRGNM